MITLVQSTVRDDFIQVVIKCSCLGFLLFLRFLQFKERQYVSVCAMQTFDRCFFSPKGSIKLQRTQTGNLLDRNKPACVFLGCFSIELKYSWKK